MCLILVASHGHPNLPCLVAANRDEFHARPSAAAQWWPDPPGILAGRPVGPRNLARTHAGGPSRGQLVTQILESTASTSQILEWLRRVATNYNAFIFSDGVRLAIYDSVSGVGRELPRGVCGLSNHLLDTPWPKVEIDKSRLSAALSNAVDSRTVLQLLRDDQPAPDALLPWTGVSIEWERLLSGAFIRAAEYGTRCSTIVRIDGGGRANFDEWTWDESGAEMNRVSIEFQLGSH